MNGDSSIQVNEDVSKFSRGLYEHVGPATIYSGIDSSIKGREAVSKFYSGLYDHDNLAKIYDERTGFYEEVCREIMYLPPVIVTKELASMFKNESLNNKLVLDIGAGSGLVGEKLQEAGFKNLHALEPSMKMLKIAKQKNVYGKFFSCYVTADPIPTIESNTYDTVVSGGCFLPNHIKMEALQEFARVTKPGGFVVITIRDFEYEMNFMEEISKLMKERVVQLRSMSLTPYQLHYENDFELVEAYVVTLQVLSQTSCLIN